MKKLLLLFAIGLGFSLLSFGQNGDVKTEEKVTVRSAKPTIQIYVRNIDAEGRVKATAWGGSVASDIWINGCARTEINCGMGPEEYVECFHLCINAGSSESYVDLPSMCDNPQRILDFYHINLSKTSDEYYNYELIF